jgi:hypothetical protein
MDGVQGDDWSGQLAGHELGHSLNRYHAECCNAKGGKPYPYANCSIGLRGLDIQSFTVYPTSRRDMMTYCWSNMWISDFTYKGLRDRIVQFPLASAQSAEPQSVLVVSGLINETTGQAELDPLYRLTVSWPEPPVPGPCTIVLQDGGRRELAQYPFTPDRDTQPMEGQDDISVVLETLPDEPEVARVELWCEGEQLAALEASPSAPTVQVLSPNGGEVWEDGSHTITWEPFDQDGDTLNFLVQVSADGGETWTTLAADLTGASFGFDTALLAGSEQALVRVVATDGLSTASDTSNATFVVAPKPPRVAIEWPSDGELVRPEETVIFSGYGYDPEDGPLPEDTLTWESDRQGFLGSGAELVISSLEPGTHRVILSGWDSHEMHASAGVTIHVGHPIYVPVILRM